VGTSALDGLLFLVREANACDHLARDDHKPAYLDIDGDLRLEV